MRKQPAGGADAKPPTSGALEQAGAAVVMSERRICGRRAILARMGTLSLVAILAAVAEVRSEDPLQGEQPISIVVAPDAGRLEQLAGDTKSVA